MYDDDEEDDLTCCTCRCVISRQEDDIFHGQCCDCFAHWNNSKFANWYNSKEEA